MSVTTSACRPNTMQHDRQCHGAHKQYVRLLGEYVRLLSLVARDQIWRGVQGNMTCHLKRRKSQYVMLMT
jgi:hypothetical protein